MLSFGEFQRVPFGDILQTDNWDMTPFIQSPRLKAQHSLIPITAVIHPPVVKKLDRTEHQYELLCGRNRLLSFQKHFPDTTHITVLVLPKNVQHSDILQYLLSDRHVSGEFSPMEKAFFLKICCREMSSKSVTEYFLPLLEEKPQVYILNNLLSLTTLETTIQEDIHSGVLSLKMGFDLLTLSQKDRIRLHKLFRLLELGGGKQKRLFSLCKDLALRLDMDFTTLFEDEELTAILNHSKMNIPQKGSSLLNLLQRRLYPEWNNAEDNFRRTVGKMQLPAECTVEHCQAFERDDVSLTIRFKNINLLTQQVQAIKTILS